MSDENVYKALAHAGLVASLLLATVASAADTQPATPPPTLSAVVEAAYRRIPQLADLSARRAEAAALDERAASFLSDSPALVGRYENDTITGDRGYQQWEAGLELPLWRFGERSASQRVATMAEAAAVRSSDALHLEAAGRVREALWAVALERNEVALSKRQWQMAQELQADVTRRVELGELARTNQLLARQETLTQRDLYEAALRAERDAEAEYRLLTGINRLPIDRREPLSARQTLAQHPQLIAAETLVEAARARVMETREAGAGPPSVLIGGVGEKDARGEDFVNRLGISVRLPFGGASHLHARVALAGRELGQALSTRDTLHRQLELDSERARNELASITDRLTGARIQKNIAQEHLQLERRAFALGEAGLLDLLRIQQRAFTAERNLTRLEHLRWRAIARINQAVGILP